MGAPQEMIHCYDKLQTIDPDNPEPDWHKGHLYQKLGNGFLATRSFANHLARLYPDRRDAIRALRAEDLAYHVNQLGLRRSPFLDYPLHVAFETYAVCNAKCSFCVYPDVERQGELMAMPLIEKIVEDLRSIPADLGFQLSPFGVNEPFIDKRLFTILDRIRDRLPNADITLTSNASPITQDKLDRLSGYRLGYLWLSVVDFRKAAYEEKMGLPFERTVARLDMIHRAKADGRLKTRVVLSRLKDDTPYDAEYAEYVRQHYPLFEVCLWPYANWIGKTANAPTSGIGNIPCAHWYELRINSSGIVVHCCMDGHGEYPWGDVKSESVLAIYNKPAWRRLRENAFSRLEVELCNRCNLR
jgi:hypothetical protein